MPLDHSFARGPHRPLSRARIKPLLLAAIVAGALLFASAPLALAADDVTVPPDIQAIVDNYQAVPRTVNTVVTVDASQAYSVLYGLQAQYAALGNPEQAYGERTALTQQGYDKVEDGTREVEDSIYKAQAIAVALRKYSLDVDLPADQKTAMQTQIDDATKEARSIEDELADDGLAREGTGADLDAAFARFEETQPAVAQLAAGVLARPLDETALALGYFLTIAVWMAFERAFGARLGEVSEQALAAAESALALEEELRATHANEPLELDDVMAIEQPSILAFVNEHVEAALEPSDGHGHGAAEGKEPREVDVDDVHAVYRNVLVMTLALSHAVSPATGSRPREMLA